MDHSTSTRDEIQERAEARFKQTMERAFNVMEKEGSGIPKNVEGLKAVMLDSWRIGFREGRREGPRYRYTKRGV